SAGVCAAGVSATPRSRVGHLLLPPHAAGTGPAGPPAEQSLGGELWSAACMAAIGCHPRPCGPDSHNLVAGATYRRHGRSAVVAVCVGHEPANANRAHLHTVC